MAGYLGIGNNTGANQVITLNPDTLYVDYYFTATGSGTIGGATISLAVDSLASLGRIALYRRVGTNPTGELLAYSAPFDVTGAAGDIDVDFITPYSGVTSGLEYSLAVVFNDYANVNSISGGATLGYDLPFANAFGEGLTSTGWNGADLILYARAGATTPTLSSPTATSITATSANVGATTTNGTAGSNTLYVVRATSNVFSGVTAAQVKAGQNASGSTTGVTATNGAISTTTPSVAQTSLSASTTYYYAIVQEDASGFSNVVTGSFTTAAVLRSTSATFVDGSNAPIVSTSLDWFLTATWAGSVVASGTTSTNGSGTLLLTDLSPAAGSYKLFYRLASDENLNGMCPVTLV